MLHTRRSLSKTPQPLTSGQTKLLIGTAESTFGASGSPLEALFQAARVCVVVARTEGLVYFHSHNLLALQFIFMQSPI